MPTVDTTRSAADPEAVRRLVRLGLTDRQAEIFLYLFETTRATGIQPSVRDVCDAFGFSSLHAPKNHLIALVKKGWIAPLVTRSRSVRFRLRPDGKPFRGFTLPEESP
jgi:SOS-response transcriptional repressor LexA